MDCPSEGEVGEVIHFTITHDASAVEIQSVTANGVECGRYGEDGYYFVMPDEDVLIEVIAEEIEDVDTVTLTNRSSSAVDLVGLPPTAAVGSEVSFYVVVKPGFNFFGDISIYTGFGVIQTDIQYQTEEKEGRTYYSFIVPSSDTSINCQTSRSSFELNYDSSLISMVYQTKIGAEYEESCREDIAEFGATIRVVMRSSEQEIVTGLRIVETGEEFEAVGEGSTFEATFTMPARSITLEPITTPYLRPLVIVNSEHLTLSTYLKDEEGNYQPTTSAVSGETVYVQVDGVNETYSIKSLDVTYTVNWETTTNLLTSGTNEDGYYSFRMPSAVGDTTITVTEKDMSRFLGYDFVGSYLGDNLYGPGFGTGKSAGSTSSYSSYNFTIGTDGGFQVRGYDCQIEEAAEGLAYGTRESDDMVFAYSDKIFFSSYNMNSLTNNDNIFAVKKQSEEDDDSLYTLDYEIFGGNYIAVQYYRNGEKYAAAFVDYSGKTVSNPNYLLDVEFVFTSGSKVTDDNASYKVVADGKTICEVGYVGAGGQANRVVMDGNQGTYSGEDGDLVLDGNGNATLGDETYRYTIQEDGTINLTLGGTVIHIQLDGENYTILETIEAANDYIGYTYRGEFDKDGDTYTAQVRFVDAFNAEFQIYWGGTLMVPNNSWPDSPVQTYEIDDAGVVTLHTYDQDGDPLTLTLTPNADKTTLTISEDMSYIYPTARTVLTRQ